MIYKVECIGDDKVRVNGTHIHTLDTFIQFLKDENKRIKERRHHFAYNGE
jgi:hypothetical protein